MFLTSLKHAVPQSAFSQKECWELLRASPVMNDLTERSASILEKVLLSDTSINKRHFATEDPATLFTLDAEALSKRFEVAAPKLAHTALLEALEAAELTPGAIDALIICTCTGYLCPGVSSYVAEQSGMRDNVYLNDIVGLGCGAAIPTLRTAQGFLAANPNATVACIAVEVCSAAFYLDNDPGVLISACLFGDAASASIWSNDPSKTGLRLHGFDTIHKPDKRELLRFTNKQGKLRNQLHRTVPAEAAKAVQSLWDRSNIDEETKIILHAGGRDVLVAVENSLEADKIQPSWEALADYGNTSSPSVLIALENQLRTEPDLNDLWISSFGAGFAAHSCRLTH